MKRMAPFFLVICLMSLGNILSANAQAGPSACTREDLRGFIDKYFTALEAHDPSRLPMASNVKFTENGIEMPVGNGFWQTAGKPLLKRNLIDTQKCGTHTTAVIEEKFDPKTVGKPMTVSMPGMKTKPLPAEGTPRPIL